MTEQSDKSAIKHYTKQDVIRLKDLIFSGIRVKQEIKDLQEGLSDTIKEVAEELDISAKQLRKVITIAFKDNLDEEQANFDQVVDILETIDRGKKNDS